MRVRGALLLLLVMGLSLSGCAPSKVEVAAQQKQACFANQRQIKTAIGIVHADSGIYPDVATVVAKLGLKCPSGGTYSFDPDTDTLTCSIHGHP